MTRYNLTEPQKKLYNYIEYFIEKNGCAPTIEEMRTGISAKSKASTHALATQLKDRGWVDWIPNKKITILMTPVDLRKEGSAYDP